MTHLTSPLLLHGDCIEQMRTLPDASVHAIVTDPPYGLSQHSQDDIVRCLTAWLAGEVYVHGKAGFMGKNWDAFVPGPEVWREALRVLKPGGHLLCFAGTRSMDLMCMAVRLAGFELRDSIGWAHDGGDPTQAPIAAWVTGQGFPKSLDVSKAIDKIGGVHPRWNPTAYADAVRRAGKSHHDVDKHLGLKTSSCYWARTDDRACVPLHKHWEAARDFLGLDDDFADVTAESLRPDREVADGPTSCTLSGRVVQVVNPGAPATEAASQWAGWGTALKPSFEPIILARKPLDGTVAANVVKHGAGALNIDACRVEPTGESRPRVDEASQDRRYTDHGSTDFAAKPGVRGGAPNGRFPANLIHDGSEGVLAAFPNAPGQQGDLKGHAKARQSPNGTFGKMAPAKDHAAREDGTKSAARFFYCAKATKADRGEGNTHSTVKPTNLMRYLCRLVTPPGGVVLDPFLGSGSTGKAAILEGFRFIGIEREEEYLAMATRRISLASEAEQSREAA